MCARASNCCHCECGFIAHARLAFVLHAMWRVHVGLVGEWPRGLTLVARVLSCTRGGVPHRDDSLWYPICVRKFGAAVGEFGECAWHCSIVREGVVWHNQSRPSMRVCTRSVCTTSPSNTATGSIDNWRSEYKMRVDVKANERVRQCSLECHRSPLWRSSWLAPAPPVLQICTHPSTAAAAHLPRPLCACGMQAYMEAVMYGRVGRGTSAPLRLLGPGLSFHKAASAATQRNATSVPVAALAAMSTATPAPPQRLDVAHRGAPPAPVHVAQASALSARQGTAKWSALGRA